MESLIFGRVAVRIVAVIVKVVDDFIDGGFHSLRSGGVCRIGHFRNDVSQAPRDDNEGRMCDHPMDRAHAESLDMPVAHEGFETLDFGEVRALLQGLDRILELHDGRNITDEDAARS